MFSLYDYDISLLFTYYFYQAEYNNSLLVVEGEPELAYNANNGLTGDHIDDNGL